MNAKKTAGHPFGCPTLLLSPVDLLVLGDDAGDHVGGEAAVDLVANHGDGGETASTDATEGVQRELAVGSAFANLDVQLASESVENFLSTTHVASCTEAYIDRMFALGLHGEEAVERNDAVYARHGDIQFVGHDFLNLGGEVAEFALNLVEDIDDLTGTVTKGFSNFLDNVDFIFR